jgi:hypothetical protein
MAGACRTQGRDERYTILPATPEPILKAMLHRERLDEMYIIL